MRPIRRMQGPSSSGGRLITRCSSSTPGLRRRQRYRLGWVWQHYGEQSTFWFYHLARERREQTVNAQLGTPGQPGHITLDTYASTQQAGQALEGYFSASSAEGLSAPPETSPQAQQELLMALDLHLNAAAEPAGRGYSRRRQHQPGGAHPDAPGLAAWQVARL